MRMNRLNEIVMRQQQKLDIHHELMLTKEKRLEVLRDAGKLHAVEAKVRSLKAHREQVEEQENKNAMLRVELDQLAGIFRQKQTDFNALVLRVDMLANQLDELERGVGYVQQLKERLDKKKATNDYFEGSPQGTQPLKYRNTLPPNSKINRPFTAMAPAGSSFQTKVESEQSESNQKPVKDKKSARRVSFDPLALLLDAALEGELDLVAKIVETIPDPDQGNDEGITALHNAICANHENVVLYLIEAGCDVNAQDADGWTPLHCAASCNNVRIARALIEGGACVYAMTYGEKDIPSEKCEKNEDGYQECFEYLVGIQNRLDGTVYAMFGYDKENEDELTFDRDEVLSVLRQGDGKEKEWYWCRKSNGDEGYVARNLLAAYPRKERKKPRPAHDDHNNNHSSQIQPRST